MSTEPPPAAKILDDAGKEVRRDRLGFWALAVSLALFVALAATWAPMADHWLSAVPFALMGWCGLLASLFAVSLGAGRVRVLGALAAAVWLGLWVLTFSEAANDTIAAVRRATLAFIAF